MNVSELIINRLEEEGFSVAFCVSGGAVSVLMDQLGKSKIQTIHNHHEQASAMAAEGYARLSKRPALVIATNGPGVTNLITGVAGAFQDSIPMLVITGQVPVKQQMSSSSKKLRQLGVQEIETGPLAKSITNFYFRATTAEDAVAGLEDAISALSNGRMGPVWLEIPLDVQAAKVEGFVGRTSRLAGGLSAELKSKGEFDTVVQLLAAAKRPLVLVGNGIHLANAEKEFFNFISTTGLPSVSTWGASDLFAHDNPNYIGNIGILGQRAANVALQNADVVLVLGSRLSVPITGYDSVLFAKKAKVLMVDIDLNEIEKETLNVHAYILSDLKVALATFNSLPFAAFVEPSWTSFLSNCKDLLSLDIEGMVDDSNYIDSYAFIDLLSKNLTNEAVVTDMGTSFTCTMQALRNTGQTRLFTSSALSSMGYGLPGAIGASMAQTNPIICIAGDGGFLMNIQELQTLSDNNLDVKIFVLNSNGYLAISIMQNNSFEGRHFGSTPESGVGAPKFADVASAFGIKSFILSGELKKAKDEIQQILSMKGPVLCEVPISPKQLMRPRVMSYRDKDTGVFQSGDLADMWPALPGDVSAKLSGMLLDLHEMP